VKTLAAQFYVQDLCEALAVSRTGYYAWRKRLPSLRARANADLLVAICQSHQDSDKIYGAPRIYQDLRAQGHCLGRHRIARLMRRAGLRGVQKSFWHPRTTDSRHDQPIAPNRLKEISAPTNINQAWVADITYVATAEGWLYVAAVMDLCSRRIVGWAADHHLYTTLVKEALSQALVGRRPAPGLLHHSDRGVQYCSVEYQRLLQKHGISASMSAKGHCYDNAAMESFWSTLKTELIHRRRWNTRAEAKLAIFEYLETFYNPRRRHSALAYQSPIDFENQLRYDNN
jgi:transposase InsO family protein